jgi:hypothetical protein
LSRKLDGETARMSFRSLIVIGICYRFLGEMDKSLQAFTAAGKYMKDMSLIATNELEHYDWLDEKEKVKELILDNINGKEHLITTLQLVYYDFFND